MTNLSELKLSGKKELERLGTQATPYTLHSGNPTSGKMNKNEGRTNSGAFPKL